MSLLRSCPDCLAVWTEEEIEDQACGCCGYPNNDSEPREADEPDMNGPTRTEILERQREQMTEWQRLK